MKKLIVLLLLFFIVLTGWSQKKAPQKKAPAKTNVKAKPGIKGKPGAKSDKAEEDGPPEPPPRILGSEIIVSADRLDIMINSPSPELFPVLSHDGSTLYFSRKNNLENKFGIKDVEDIWYSTLVNGKWDYAKNMSHQNTIEADYVCQIVAPSHGKDGQETVILGNDYKLEGNKKAPLSMAHTLGKDRWSRPEHVRITGTDGFSEKTDCFMTRDRKYLIISWTPPAGGVGGRDLYVATAGPSSIFEKLQNLGRDINTKGNDRSPFMLSDERVLFFSSDGFPDTKGGQDVYVSYRLKGKSWTSWSPPRNLGPKINTSMDELGFTVHEETNKAFFCRGVSDVDTDIFMSKVSFGQKSVTITGKFVDKVTKKPIVGRVLLIENSTGRTVLNTNTDAATGTYSAKVSDHEKYHLFAINSKGVRSEPVIIDLEKPGQSVVQPPNVLFGADDEKPGVEGATLSASEDTKLPPLPPLEIIRYKKDSVLAGPLQLFTLTDISSFAYMYKRAQIMISGFTDSKQANSEDQANERIREITDYFVKRGVEGERVRHQLKPAEPNKNEENTCQVQIMEQ